MEGKEKGKKEGEQKKEREKWMNVFFLPLFLFFMALQVNL